MKILIALMLLGTIACTPMHYSKPQKTYKYHVSQETHPTAPYSRAISAGDLK